MPSSLSELTLYQIRSELTHLGLEASKYAFISKLRKYKKVFKFPRKAKFHLMQRSNNILIKILLELKYRIYNKSLLTTLKTHIS